MSGGVGAIGSRETGQPNVIATSQYVMCTLLFGAWTPARAIPAALLLLGCQPQSQTESASIPAVAVAFEETGTAVETTHTLHPQTLLAIPDMTHGSEWLSVVSDMRYDAVSGTFLVMDRRTGTVAEVDTLGALVHIYGGGLGRGPHEVRDLVDYAFSPTSVAFLDRGNNKVLVYPRLGRRARLFPVSPAYRSIALAADETILVAPGTGLHAVDVHGASGDLVGGVGAFEELPVRCTPEENCDRTRGMSPPSRSCRHRDTSIGSLTSTRWKSKARCSVTRGTA